MFFQGPGVIFLFLSVGAVALFGFLAVAAWSGARQQERESYYRNDMLKKLAESDTQSSAATIAYLQEKERAAEAKSHAKKREGYVVGGLVNIGVGIALIAFLAEIAPNRAVGLVGLIPALIGVALLISAFLFAPRKAA
ncbi:hypothetical protein H7849_10780 [Alloacidobacterium dinghuense]|uniref:Uncharacterized protein n=1 Tax=Alloacidobacterium dinghuense TaxID=2763107 RepID=A0A7G8BP58_9BACT|nr:hypothetical protein [Alloacidobacterium dinghuense]QNI34328.1 hypothetical protein H7849_10780 [Alloacidobacterium dinghuense]